MSRDGKIRFYLFFFFLCLYILAAGKHYPNYYYSGDERIMIYTGISLAEDQSFEIPEVYDDASSRYGVVPSLVMIPFFLAGKAVASFYPIEYRELVVIHFIYLLNAFVTAFLVSLFYHFSRFLKYPRKTAVYSSLILGSATILFPYSKYFFSAPLVALLLLLSLFELVKFRRKRSSINLLLSSLYFGILLHVRIDNLFLLPVFIAGLLFMEFQRKNHDHKSVLKEFLINSLIFLIVLAPFIALYPVLNYLKYGTFSSTGYGGQGFTTPVIYGMFGLLVSAGRSLFLYSPPLILIFLAAGRFRRRFSFIFFLILFCFLFKLVLFSKWWVWDGALSWGGRFLLPVVPLLLIPLNELLLRYKRYAGGFKLFIMIFIVFGIFVQVTAVLGNFAEYNMDIFAMVYGDENQYLYIPQISGIPGNLELIKSGRIDSFLPGGFERLGRIQVVFTTALLLGGIIVSFLKLKSLTGLKIRDTIKYKPVGQLSGFAKWVAVIIAVNAILWAACHWTVSMQKIAMQREIVYKSGQISGMITYEDYIFLDRIDKDAGEEIELTRTLWECWFRAPLSGEYRFYIKVQGLYEFKMDNRIVKVKTEETPQVTNEARVRLDKGYHSMALRYTATNPSRQVCRLYVTFPGTNVYKRLVPTEYLYRQKPGAIMKILLKMNDYKIFLFLFSVLLLYLVWFWNKNKMGNSGHIKR